MGKSSRIGAGSSSFLRGLFFKAGGKRRIALLFLFVGHFTPIGVPFLRKGPLLTLRYYFFGKIWDKYTVIRAPL